MHSKTQYICNASILPNGKTFGEIMTDRCRNKPSQQSFESLFGDLSGYIYSGTLDLSLLNLSSLKGCPKTIRGGYFSIDRNPNLENLDYFPENIDNEEGFFLDYQNLPLLKNLDINLYKDAQVILMISKEDKSACKKEIVLAFSEFRKINGNFDNFGLTGANVAQTFSIEEFEKLYLIYEKVGFNWEKFERALKLL